MWDLSMQNKLYLEIISSKGEVEALDIFCKWLHAEITSSSKGWVAHQSFLELQVFEKGPVSVLQNVLCLSLERAAKLAVPVLVWGEGRAYFGSNQPVLLTSSWNCAVWIYLFEAALQMKIIFIFYKSFLFLTVLQLWSIVPSFINKTKDTSSSFSIFILWRDYYIDAWGFKLS